MNVLAKPRRSLAVLASASSFSRGTRSILFSTRILSCRTVASLPRMASASSSIPALASSSTQTRSASCAPLHAVDTIARSSLRFGEKIPGVSTRMICALFSITMPRISARVVCTLRDTIVTLEPISAFTSVDLPTLGAPINATKPQRVPGAASAAELSVIAAAADAFARDHDGCRDLFGRAFAAADALCRRETRQIDGHSKLRIVVRAGTFDLPVNRGRQPLALRPFLQNGFRIAQRTSRLAHPLGPVPLHELRRSRVAAIEEHRADHGLADVAKHGFSQARPCARAHRAELDVIEKPERLGDLRATLLAHEIGEAFGQLALVRVRKRPVEHVRDDQPENVVAQEFKSLIAVAALARQFQCGHVSEGGHQQSRIAELVPDPRLDSFGGRLCRALAPLLASCHRRALSVRLRACFA